MKPTASQASRPSVPRLLAGQRELARWTLEGGAAPRAPWGWRAQLRWHAWWFERLSRQQSARLARSRPGQAPVFVLGFWRSGTTVLHEWLAGLPGYAAPATWQCFNPASFLLTGQPRREGTGVARPMDGGWIAPDSPQEDEFALLLQGAPSLYRGFIDPRRLKGLPQQVFEGGAGSGEAQWIEPWLAFLAGVEQQAGGDRLVLKSPNHVFRLHAIRRVFPDAPWVWIGRPAAAVWHSNLRMWQSMMDTYGLWTMPAGSLEGFLDTCMARYVEELDWATGALSADQVQWVEFDELYADPAALLLRLTRRLPQPAGRDWGPETLRALLRAHPVEPPGTRASEVPSPRAELFAAYDAAHARARNRWGAAA